MRLTLRAQPGLGGLALILLLGFLVACERAGVATGRADPSLQVPVRSLPAPTGPFAIGTTELLWTDEDRHEPFTRNPDDRRRILVQIWYPAIPEGDAARARYIQSPNEFGDAQDMARIQNVETHAVRDASLIPPATARELLTPLVFHHGGGWTRFSSSFLTEELASRGFVVVAVEHPGFNRTVLYPDGYRFEADTLAFPTETGDLRTDALAFWTHLEKHHFTEWQADSHFVLDRLEELARDPVSRFFERLDLDSIGMLGWSFGGALAIQMSRDDPRVKAAVDLDGQLFGDVADLGTGRPFLLVHGDSPSTDPASEASDQERQQAEVMVDLIERVRGRDLSLLEHSTEDRYDIHLRGAQHASFSDLVLFDQTEPLALSLSPKRGHAIIRRLVVGFFDRYLRAGRGDFLRAIEHLYPEVEVAVRVDGSGPDG